MPVHVATAWTFLPLKILLLLNSLLLLFCWRNLLMVTPPHHFPIVGFGFNGLKVTTRINCKWHFWAFLPSKAKKLDFLFIAHKLHEIYGWTFRRIFNRRSCIKAGRELAMYIQGYQRLETFLFSFVFRICFLPNLKDLARTRCHFLAFLFLFLEMYEY